MNEEFDVLLKSLQAATEQKDDDNDEDNKLEDDNMITQAAEEGEEPSDELDDEDEDETKGKKKSKPMAKSMVVQGDNGEMVEAIDATDLLKSMIGRQDTQEFALTEALKTVVALTQKQGQMLKSLSAKVDALGAQGAGRKSVMGVSDGMAKSMSAAGRPQAMKPDEVMVKCLSAQKLGKITGLDVARAEASFNAGVAVPADILQRLN